MKISVSSYSFTKLIKDGSLTQLDTIRTAKEMGFDAIEFSDILPHDGSTTFEYAIKLKEECEKLNIPVSNFTFAADFINGCDGDTKKEIERVKGRIDIAEILGAKSVRHDATIGGERCKTFDAALPLLADACREVTEYAAQMGIKTMIENHGFFCQDALRVEKLFNAVNHPNFGILCDMGNFLCADEDPAKSVGIVAPYTFYAHAKDFHVKSAMEPDPGEGFFRSRNGNYLRGAIIGQGNVPVLHCLYALKRAEYKGMISIEYEGHEDTLTGIRIGLQNLRKYIEVVDL